jgi:predicted RecA/RadA family phage recombinase
MLGDKFPSMCRRTSASSSYRNLTRVFFRSVATALLFCVLALSAFAQTPVLTQHNDTMRTGQNTTETILNTSNVNVSQFGKIFAMPTDGQVYAQPLYVPGVTINGAVHNVLIVATENDSVYAYDADSSSNSVPLWKANLLDAAHGASAGETPVNSAIDVGCTDVSPLIGITATPVIDSVSHAIYVEAKSTNGSSYFHRLHALSILTGGEISPGPTLITATVAGTGDGSTGGQLTFNPLQEQARPGLLLSNSTIYIAFASHCDYSPFHGWVFAYDETTLTRKSVYVTTPNGGDGGFWMSGAGIAADSSGNIFIPSGNGDFDTVNVPATETGDTLLKLGTTNQTLTLLDYFTPTNQLTMDDNDKDLGSGGTLLVPVQPGSSLNIMVQAGKQGQIYVVDRDQLTTGNTHYCSGCATDTEILEETSVGAVGGIFSVPAYWNSNIYIWGNNDLLKSIPITAGLPNLANITTGSIQFGFPGATPSVSSNGTTASTAILWAVNSSAYKTPGPAVLYAFTATNISNQLWDSGLATNNRDMAGNAVKFATPTISNGKVYVGTASEVDVYGLLSGVQLQVATPQISPATGYDLGSVAVTITDSTPGATITYTTDGSTPVPGSHGTAISSGGSFTLTSSGTVTAIASATGSTNSLLATASYTVITGAPPATLNYGAGFAGESNLVLNGTAMISGSALSLTNGVMDQAGSAYFWQPMNIQSFTNNFSFQLTNASADGFTFTIQNAGPTALGTSGGGLGYGGILTSVAVKFDLFNNAGEGSDSTGLYIDGASPTIPAVDMTSSGVNLHSGDILQVQMSYSGTTLAMTVTDATTGATFSQTFSVNIPSVVGSNTAYVGFTGATEDYTAVQQILSWSYAPGPVQASEPLIAPAPGNYSGSVPVTITDTTSGALITYTVDGSTPIPGSHGTAITSGSSFTLTSSGTVSAIASATGLANSLVATAAYNVVAGPPPVNFSTGFSGETSLTLNGSATITGGRLRLTNGGASEASSAFYSTPVNIQSFTNNFSFQITNAAADGFTFTIQGAGPTALGAAGGNLGYTGIPTSVAVKFDFFNNTGAGNDATGIYTDGAAPTTPAFDMTSSGVLLLSGDIFQVQMSYSGTTLAMTVTDTATGRAYTQNFTINIPSTVGGNTAYVGFTAGDGGLTSIQDIIGWTLTPGLVQAATPVISPAAGNYTSSVPVTITDATSGATIVYTTDGSTPLPGTNGTEISSGGSFTLTSSATVTAIASASGFTNSNTAAAAYTIGAATQAATPLISPAANSYVGSVVVTITDATSGATITYTTDGSTPVPGSHGTAISSGGSFTLTSSATVTAIASASGDTNSNTAAASYTITAPPLAATPLISPTAGSYVTSVLVTITDATSGATITYTTDGSTPVPGSHGTAISSGGSFTLTSSATVTAIASASGDTNSNTAATAYTITAPPVVATPLISPAANSYVGSVLVTITDATSGATITYTTDGSTPVPGSHGTAISSGGSFTLTSSATVKAIASASGDTNSNMATTAYTITVPPPAATPVISPAASSHVSSVVVSITDATSGATITYTTDGSTPIPGSHGTAISSGGSFTLTSSATVQAIASATNYSNSALASSAYTVTVPPVFNFGAGFTGETALTLNGSAAINGTRLRLTNGANSQAGSAFYTLPVNIQSFINNFSFQITDAAADGFTFTIQGAGPTALGTAGGNLGYTGIPNSVAVKFDFFNNTGAGNDATGIYTNGAAPTTPAFDMTSSGVKLLSGDILQVQMSYDGTTLTMTVTDTTTGATFTQNFTINIPGTIGSNTAYVGFTAGDGGLTSIQDIVNWSYTPGPATAATPAISPAAGSYVSSVPVTITDTTSGATITYTTDGSAPVPGSHGTAISSGGSFTLTSSATVTAIASASGFANSNTATAAYIVTVPTQAATPVISPAAGSYVNSVGVTITDSTSGATITYTTDGSTPIPGSHGTAISSGGSFTLTSSATVTAIASVSGLTNSLPASAAYTVTIPPPVSFNSGFAGETSLTLNGSAAINGTRLRLTNGAASQAGSAFYTLPINIQAFTNNFTFQLTDAVADGFTFTIQGASPTALGTAGGNLGYTGIPNSVAVKFDFLNNTGSGNDATGIYTDGAAPTTPAIDMTSSGVKLLSGDILQVQMSYNGTTLAMTVTDTTTEATFTQNFTINIPSTVGGNTAYVGFTGGDGGLTSIQDILSWSYTP